MNMEFKWIPHKGIDLEAVERMKQHFAKPSQAPHEAWFMSPNPIYFTELVEFPIKELDAGTLEQRLSEMASGIKCFPAVSTEWIIWFPYLFPYALERILEEGLLNTTIAYFINVYQNEIVEEYPGFREDVLRTLPHSIMKSELWDGDDLSKTYWWYDEWEGYWTYPLYATLFFCLKYLNPDEIPSWVTSIAEIRGEYWKSQISAWLSGASRFFDFMAHPEKIPDTDKVKQTIEKGTIDEYMEIARINWWRSYLVFRGTETSKNLFDYLSKENIETFWNEVKSIQPCPLLRQV